jgi:hypothetical protein
MGRRSSRFSWLTVSSVGDVGGLTALARTMSSVRFSRDKVSHFGDEIVAPESTVNRFDGGSRYHIAV